LGLQVVPPAQHVFPPHATVPVGHPPMPLTEQNAVFPDAPDAIVQVCPAGQHASLPNGPPMPHSSSPAPHDAKVVGWHSANPAAFVPQVAPGSQHRLPHCVSPAAHAVVNEVHVPKRQDSVAAHVTPQAPQLSALRKTFSQVNRFGVLVAQTDSSVLPPQPQDWPSALHPANPADPLPQHTLPHCTSPAAHRLAAGWHVPLWQVSPSPHAPRLQHA
jgi:hypothetical protein